MTSESVLEQEADMQAEAPKMHADEPNTNKKKVLPPRVKIQTFEENTEINYPAEDEDQCYSPNAIWNQKHAGHTPFPSSSSSSGEEVDEAETMANDCCWNQLHAGHTPFPSSQEDVNQSDDKLADTCEYQSDEHIKTVENKA